MRKTTLVRNMLMSSVFALALLSTVFSPSVSALGCSGNGCNGKDPAKTGCNGNAYIAKRTSLLSTSTGKPIKDVYMDIYYSRSCNTNWVRVTSNPYGGNAFKTISVAQNGGYTENETDSGYGSSYSMQVYAPGSTPVQAWANLKDKSGKIRASTPEVLIR